MIKTFTFPRLIILLPTMFVLNVFSVFSQTEKKEILVSNNSYNISDNLWNTYINKTAVLLEKVDAQSFLNYVVMTSDGNMDDMQYFKNYISLHWKKDFEELAYKVGRGDISTEQNIKVYLSSLQPSYKKYFVGFQKQRNEIINSQNKSRAPIHNNPHTQNCGSPCTNPGFEPDSTFWNFWAGDPSTGADPINLTAGFNPPPSGSFGTNPNPHMITAIGGYDPTVGGTILPVVPQGGGNHALRLGDLVAWGGNSWGAARASISFTVSASNPNFTYRYAVVLHDPGTGHADPERPYFKVKVSDAGGNIVPCGDYYITAKAPFTGFIETSPGSNMWYRPWAAVFVPLQAYIGQCITIEFTASDCVPGGHLGYAYIDCACDPLSIVSSSQNICGGSSVTLTAPTGGAHYLWTNSSGGIAGIISSDTMPTAIVNQADTYNVVFTSITGQICQTTLSITIGAASPGAVSNAGNDLTICSGTPGGIGAASVSGYTYSWSPNTGLNDYTVSNPTNTTVNNTTTPIVTTYIVTSTLIANGCQSMDTAIIKVNPQSVLSITNPAASCFPNTVDITAGSVTAGSTGGGILSYWMDAGATNTLSSPNAIAISGVNYIKVTAIGGCTDIKSVTATINPQPIVSFSGLDGSYCYYAGAQTLTGSPAGGTFSGYGINSNVFTPSIAGSGGDNVTYTYTDGNTCTNYSTQFTEVLPLPIAPNICMVTVDSASNYNIIYWDKSSYTNIDSFIVYRETVSNTYKRIGAVSIDSMSLLIETVRQLYFPFTGNPNMGTYRYKLQIRDTCGNYSALGPYHNTIYVTQTGSNFNWNNYQIENQPTPITQISSYQLLRDNNNTGNWSVIGGVSGSQLTISDPNYGSYPNGRWRIQTTWSISCIPSRSINTTLSNIKGNLSTGIDEANEFSSSISIYPNPYSGKTTITYSLQKKSNVIVEIYNAIGQKVETLVNNDQTAGEYKCNFSAKEKGYNEGLYFVKINVDGKTLIRRIVEIK